MNTTSVIVAALVTWRLSHLLLRENGPFHIFKRIRRALGVAYDDLEADRVVSFKYELTVCIWCLSMWVGAVVVAVLYEWPHTMWFMLPFALSAVASLIGVRK